LSREFLYNFNPIAFIADDLIHLKGKMF